MPTTSDPGSRSRSRGLGAWVAEIGRHHLRPLTLLEIAALVVALILGWKLVAIAILVWHVLRMGWAMLSDRARRRGTAV